MMVKECEDRITQLEGSLGDIHGEVSAIKAGCESMSSRLGVLETHMTSIAQILSRIEANSSSGHGQTSGTKSSSLDSPQVNHPLLDLEAKSLGKRLLCIQQTGEIAEYINEFEELSTQVTGISEATLTNAFYNDLKPTMKEVIEMKDPQGLTNHKAAVMKMQSSGFFQTALSSVRVLSRTPADQERTYRDRPAHNIRAIPPSPRPSSRTDPGSNVPRSSRSCLATTSRARPRPRTGKQCLAAVRHNPCPTADPSVRPGRLRPTSGQNLWPIHPSADHDGRTKTLGVPIADHDPIAGRSSRPTVRTSDRPEARFEARFTRFHGPA
ncbi:unnamed protein product [Microthlaspi erraticum]|uniref:Retrotransposon gag domain-containing protein n=1 Tax=Microthlaspi erraticum TaxID=1685480 RepID=A0A6D2HWE1_9BRAS|nr:unnamed protein product [Microthlaspi erraticum]